jgi:hypothetical protein
VSLVPGLYLIVGFEHRYEPAVPIAYAGRIFNIWHRIINNNTFLDRITQRLIHQILFLWRKMAAISSLEILH